MKRHGICVVLLGCAVAAGSIGCRGLSTTETQEMAANTSVSATATPTPTTIVETPPPNNWDKVTPPVEPSGRSSPAMAYDPIAERTILFGGEVGRPGSGGCVNDTWAFDSSSNTWVELDPSGAVPRGRRGHVMLYVPTMGKMLMFGGSYEESGWHTLSDTWTYDVASNTWTELHPTGTQPVSRMSKEIVYDPENDKALLFSDNGVWAYDPVSNAWRELVAIPETPTRIDYAAVYEPNTRKVLTFGGDEFVTVRAFDPATYVWTRLDPPEHPPFPRATGHAMVYHPGCSLVLLFGGVKYTTYVDRQLPINLMAYDPVANNWANLGYADRVPYGRSDHAMVYESKSGKVIMFGGCDDEWVPLSGTWILSP